MALAGLTGGCFQPIYGERAAYGSANPGIGYKMAGVEVAPIDAPNGSRIARIGVNVRNELIYDLTGGGSPASATHQLKVNLSANTQQVIVDINTARPDIQNYSLNAIIYADRSRHRQSRGQRHDIRPGVLRHSRPGAALRRRARLARRRRPRRQGHRREHPLAPGVVFRGGDVMTTLSSREARGLRPWDDSDESMTAIKASDVDRFIAKPDPSQPIVLVFGPDAGLVRERVDALVRASVEDPNDPFAFVRIEGEELSANPSRLVEEAHTVPLFGGRRAVLVKAGSRNIAGAVETVVAAPSEECRIIIEAGDLKKSSPLRALCEKAKVAAALPCYADNARDLERLIDEEMRAAEISIASDARAALLGAARRRPSRLARRNPQARALRPRPATPSSSPM